jgi:CheY-like chemotaxis protein/DNA-binding CsgD family transcriptional regulator
MGTVLVVDDEPDLRDVVRINLALDGHRVIEAGDGAEALRVIGAERPDVIVLDVTMPVVDGWEFLATLKAGPAERAAIPVVILSGRTAEMDRLRGGIEGAIRYIAKPFSVAELRQEVAQANQGDPEPVKRRRAQHEALARLARLERGAHPDGDADRTGRPPARPRLTRLEAVPGPQRPPGRSAALERGQGSGLSSGQSRLLRVVGATPSVREAAERLGVSRSYVYATLRRIAHKLGVDSGPELVGLARRGAYAASE